MSSLALVDATTWIGGFDWTTVTNSVQLSAEAAELDNTTFGSGGYRSRIAGNRSIAAAYNGFWEAGATSADALGQSTLGTMDQVVTMTPTGAASDVAYMFQAGTFGYQPFGQMGEVAPFTLTMAGSNPSGLVRGRLTRSKASVNSTGASGTGQQLGAVGATQFLYTTFHIFSAGTTITAVIESDDNAPFASATTRSTIGPLTTTGGTWVTRVAGPITDDFFRLRITAITGTFSIACAVGIGS